MLQKITEEMLRHQNVRVGEALTKSTKSRASCGGAMVKAVVENGRADDATKLGLDLVREWRAILDRLAVKEKIMQREARLD